MLWAALPRQCTTTMTLSHTYTPGAVLAIDELTVHSSFAADVGELSALLIRTDAATGWISTLDIARTATSDPCRRPLYLPSYYSQLLNSSPVAIWSASGRAPGNATSTERLFTDRRRSDIRSPRRCPRSRWRPHHPRSWGLECPSSPVPGWCTRFPMNQKLGHGWFWTGRSPLP